MFDFSNEKVSTGGSSYVRTSGLHQGVDFKGLSYVATETYECFDLNFEKDGAIFKDRTFSVAPDRALIKDIYGVVDSKRQVVGKETPEEAYNRTFKEFFFKLLHLVSCFTDETEAQADMSKFNSFKELVDKTNEVLSKVDTSAKLNVLTVWKNRDDKQTSNLIIPERIKWVEITTYNADGTMKPANIKLTTWQNNNQMTEKYPYGSTTNESTGSDSTILNDINTNQDSSSSLPF